MNETPFENILTVIARPGGLNDAIVAAAAIALKGLGAELAPPDWFAPGEAADITFEVAVPASTTPT